MTVSLHMRWSEERDPRTGKPRPVGVEARCHQCPWVKQADYIDPVLTRAVEVHELQLCRQRSLFA